jgi:hypothetical protein
MREVGLYLIISTGSFYDGLINLNKFFRIVGAVILINVAYLEHGRPPNPLSSPTNAQNPLLPVGVTSLARNHCGGLQFCGLIFNDVAEIIPITAIFLRTAVLCDALACIVLG